MVEEMRVRERTHTVLCLVTSAPHPLGELHLQHGGSSQAMHTFSQVTRMYYLPFVVPVSVH